MQINYYKNKRTIPSWIKWLFIVVVLILLILAIYGIILYKNIQEAKTKNYSQTEKMVLDKTDIVTIDKTTHYYGEKVYHIVFGHTTDDVEEIAFVEKSDNNDDNEHIETFDSEEMISEENILTLWRDECSSCKLVKVNAAMIDKKALWELTYEDADQHYIIDYLSMDDGSRYEQYRFKRTFK